LANCVAVSRNAMFIVFFYGVCL